MTEFVGTIRNVYADDRIFDVIYKDQVVYFYLSRSLFKKFEPYLMKGYVFRANVNDNKKNINNISCYSIASFDKIYKMIGNKEVIYFDKSEVKQSYKKLLNKDNNRLFIDLEFSMPPFNYHSEDKTFFSEIVEYGMILEDDKGNVIDSCHGYIRPKCKLAVNDRTLEFLSCSAATLQKADYYSTFYHTLQDYMMLYQPQIYIWGKNDFLMINSSFEEHKVKPICERHQFINLLQLFKTYFNLRDDPGLFKSFDLFHKSAPFVTQDHNPLHDAEALRDLFHLFIYELEK